MDKKHNKTSKHINNITHLNDTSYLNVMIYELGRAYFSSNDEISKIENNLNLLLK